MQGYEDLSDLSEMLKRDFSEQVEIDEKSMFVGNLLLDVSKPPLIDHILKAPSLFTLDKTDSNKQELDIQEFFPPSKRNFQTNELVKTISISQQNPESPNQTVDSVGSSEKNGTEFSKNYDKNLLGNIARKSIDILFESSKKLLINRCIKLGIKYKQFEKYYKNLQKKIYGPQSLIKLFEVNQKDPKDVLMKALFNSALTKIIRKRYLLYSLKYGKMQNTQSYIRKKNTHLLYFVDQLQNALKNSSI